MSYELPQVYGLPPSADKNVASKIDALYQYKIGDIVQLIQNANPFEIVNRHHGCFGAIYIAKSISTEWTSAFKTPQLDREYDEREYREFAREGNAWVALPTHPNIV